jgi:hypothetical protein
MKRTFGALVFLSGVMLLVATPSPVLSRTIYVDWANVSGTEDGSSAQPFTTVTRGYGAATSGDTIVIRAGSYSERLTLNKAILYKAKVEPLLIGSAPVPLPYDLVSAGPDDIGRGQRCALTAPRWDKFNNISKNPFWGYQVTSSNCPPGIPDPHAQCPQGTNLIPPCGFPPESVWITTFFTFLYSATA